MWRGIGYGIVDFVGGGSMTIIGAWMLFFYTSYCNLTAVQGASIIGAARVADAICSLLMGSLTDNFYKTKLGQRFGRRHFFLLIGSPLMLLYITLWIAGMNYWYYFATYMIFEVISSAMMIPYETLPNEMTDDYNQRTKLSSARMFISAGATFLATFIPGQLFAIMGQHSPIPFLVNGTLFAIIFAIGVYVCYSVTWEKPVTKEMRVELEKDSVNEGSLLKRFWGLLCDYGSTLKIKSFRKHLLIYLFSFTGKDTFNTVFAYFCIYCLGLSATVAANMLSLSLVGLLVTIVAGFGMVKFGPKFLYEVGYGLMLLMLVGYYLVFRLHVTNHVILILFFISLVYQIGRATLEFTPWNVFPFIPDLDEIVTKRRRAGVFAAVMSFTRKSTVAVATVAVGFILDSNGFAKNAATQSVQTQHAIAAILLFGTGGLILLALLEALTFKLNKQTHQIIIQETLRLRKGGSKKDVDPEVAKTVHELTGVPYDKVWPDD
ncbi:MFS transporter [Lentilactobacillus kisonensis]|uniref:Transporter, major facilitator family protein n=1 Tax=Lentilactobacillus kisonensis F0435 TaxID=797516 RepID=H1LG30_9LACO|nr:MFS transporter [Lentilactobacillus kisonensis]EHO51236.1 transporter, major facilitator family protein [Lentilactobacillus kisonensis F0435]